MSSNELTTTQVLRCRDLFLHITGYQNGIYSDMHQFLVFVNFPASVWITIPPNELERMNRLLSPWYATCGTSRLRHLFSCMRYMLNICVLHSVHFGLLDVLKSIHQHTKLHWFGYPLMEMAAISDHLDCVRFVQGKSRQKCSRRAIYHAIRHGNLDLVKLLMELLTDHDRAVMDLAAQYGHLELVQFFHEKSINCTTDAMDSAAANGHLDIVNYLHMNRREGCTHQAIISAASNGHLEVVRYLIEHHLQENSLEAINSASERGHVEVVKFLSNLLLQPIKLPPIVHSEFMCAA